MEKPNFTSVVFFYTNIALQHLGIVKNPLTDKVEKNLEIAKYTIDTLDMLKEKTKGNLEENEEKLLASTISDLTLAYVKMKETGGKREEGGEKIEKGREKSEERGEQTEERRVKGEERREKKG